MGGHGDGRARERYWSQLLEEPVPGVALSFSDLGGGRSPRTGQLTVAAFELLDGRLPQPDASLLYDLLTRAPRRRPGEWVELATVGGELAGAGLGFAEAGIDVLAITTSLADLVRHGQLRPLAP